MSKRNTTTIRLQIFNSAECLLDTHDVTVANPMDGEAEDAASTALIKLLRNEWTLAAGDVIRINEV